MAMRPSTTISTKDFSNTIDSIKEIWKNTLASLALSTKLLTSTVAIAATWVLTFTWCWTTETIDRDHFNLAPWEINIYEKFLEAWTYEIEVSPYSQDWDPAMEIKLWNNFYDTEYYTIDNNYAWESEKIRFTLSEPEKIKIYIQNVWNYESSFSLRITKEKDYY